MISALALSRARRLDARSSAILIASSVLPDLIDKSVYLTGLAPVSRNVTHNVGLWVCVTALWLLYTRRWKNTAAATLILAGVWCHIITDFVDDAVGGVCQHGWVVESWFLWPLLRNTSHFILIPGYPDARGAIPVSPLEIISYVGFAIWLAFIIYSRSNNSKRADNQDT